MHVAVLGASGFIGREVVVDLVTAGHAVTSITRSDGARVAGQPGSAHRLVDIRDAATLRRTVAELGADVVVNLATVRTGDDASLAAVNARAPRTLAHACADAGTARLVHVTSATEYGDAPAPLREDVPRRPTTRYGRHRLAGTEAALAVGAERGLDVVVLPVFLAYGPEMPQQALLPRAVACALSGEVLPLTPRGATRDLVHVDDVARAVVAAVERPHLGGLVVNICSGVATDNHDLVDLVGQVVGRPVRTAIGAEPLRAWDRADWRGDPSRARELLDWTTMVGLREGILGCVEAWWSA